MRLVWRASTSALESALAAMPSEVSYAPVGGTRGDLPDGWRHVDRTWALPSGSFDRAAALVLDLSVLRLAGLRVAAAEPLMPGSPILQAVPVGPVSLLAPCRVAYVLTSGDVRGFAYGTVTGHPESGEEAFLVHREGERVWLSIRSFTRPGGLLTRVGWPVAGLVVRLAVARYGRSLVRAVS